jgi:hypothetical protein
MKCEALARKGTGTGICDKPLDHHGVCPQPWDHIEEPYVPGDCVVTWPDGRVTDARKTV